MGTPANTNDGEELEGWKAIGALLGISGEAAQNYNREGSRCPIPVSRNWRGRIVSTAAKIAAWKVERARLFAAESAEVAA